MMKSTGIVRRADSLNRVVIPKELCRVLGIEPGTPMEIFMDESRIILQKYEPGCVICGFCGDLVNYKGKNFCTECLGGLKKVGE